MRKNLLSVAKLTKDNNVFCVFDSTHFYIFDRTTGDLLFQGLCKDGLYPLSPARSSLQALAASRLLSSTWHSRLGHPSVKLCLF